MATPSEKLAQSLEALAKLQRADGDVAIRARDLSRTHRERLLAQWERFWSRMWRSAKRTLQSSERIVVCGYGMYPIDRRGRNLLLKGALAGDIEVCCGGESPRIVQELRDHGRRVRQADQTYFEQWVSAQ